MNNGNFFSNQDEDENESFRDIPDEVSGGDAPAANVRVQRPAAPAPQPAYVQETPMQYEEESAEQIEQQEDEDFSSVLSDARSRLEQGRLYELIMNSELFQGADGDEKATKQVQREIRKFAKERMEIMLGMRPDVSKEPQQMIVSSPFNDLEVQTLKALASAATKGATSHPEAQQFGGFQAATPVKTTLSPITLKQQVKQAPRTPAPVQQKAAPAKPLANRPQQPVKRSSRDEAIERILAEEGISREEYEKQYPPDYKALDKPLTQMSEQEMKDRARQMKSRSPGQVKSALAIPMPTPEQEEMMHTSRAHAAASHPQMQTLMNILINTPKKQ